MSIVEDAVNMSYAEDSARHAASRHEGFTLELENTRHVQLTRDNTVAL